MFHNSQRGICLDSSDSKIGGTLLLKHRQLEANEDYTLIDCFIYNRTPHYVGRKDLKELDAIDVNMQNYDLIMSGQKRSKDGNVATINFALENMVGGRPFLVLAHTKTEIIILGFYKILDYTEDLDAPLFTHKFFFKRS